MGATAYVTDLLNSTLSAIQAVIPARIMHSSPALIERSFMQSDKSVLIGITGEIPGRLILDGHHATFSNLAQTMYGMALEGDMLDSFVGEIGNMVAGNAVSELSMKGVSVNISPPTVFVGETKITGFEQGIQVPLELRDVGAMNVVLIVESKK